MIFGRQKLWKCEVEMINVKGGQVNSETQLKFVWNDIMIYGKWE